MRIGLLGGTFDPVHIGHLRVAEEVREKFSLDRIYFILSYQPPHKKELEISDASLRLAMLRKALRGNSSFRASDVEIRRGGVSYSIDTLRHFGRRFGDLYFLVGIDAFSEIDTWHDYSQIFSSTNLIVMVRPTDRGPGTALGFPADVVKEIKMIDETTFEHISGKKVYVHRVTQLDISSTRIRGWVKKGGSIRYLVTPPVEEFIAERRLYRT
jgi:nicotinate-nucleotide adenylyltransferase